MNNKVKLFNYIFPEIKNKFIPVYCNKNQINININTFNRFHKRNLHEIRRSLKQRNILTFVFANFNSSKFSITLVKQSSKVLCTSSRYFQRGLHNVTNIFGGI